MLCFTLYIFEGNFPITSPRGGGGGAYIWRGDLTEDFLCYQFGGLIFNLEGFIFGILQYDNFCIIYYVKLQFTVWGRYRTPSFCHSTIGCGEPDTLQTKS